MSYMFALLSILGMLINGFLGLSKIWFQNTFNVINIFIIFILYYIVLLKINKNYLLNINDFIIKLNLLQGLENTYEISKYLCKINKKIIFLKIEIKKSYYHLYL